MLDYKESSTKTKFISVDPIYGVVDFGEVDINTDRFEWNTKMRCKVCGGAWLAENYVGGSFICPKCGATDKKVMSVY